MFFFFLFFLFYLLLAYGVGVSFFWGATSLSYYFFSLGGVDLSFSVFFDFVSLMFFGVVSFISAMVFFYSVFYMDGTVDSRRFYWLVFGFVLSMGLLVFSGNFLSLMIGWDGLGLISFCLVVFYSNYSSLESGLVTVLSNRVGDVFFLGCFFIFFMSGEKALSDSFEKLSLLIYSFLFLGAITKSAQFPFSAWLPAAMAAPTPVSSLVHSSTLVTAGIYVLLRFNYVVFIFNLVFLKLFFILTMVLAGACANLETDFKKIVAMSTLSQLGMMMFVLSVGAWFLTFMHMLIHAFFKSLLFMSTGALMSNFSGGQDSRFYGGDSFSFCAFLCFLVSSLCLMGFPFFIGFYSKDMIILGSSVGLGLFFYFLFLSGCFLTICYSLRLLRGSFGKGLVSFFHVSYASMKIFVISVTFLFLKSWFLGSIFIFTFFYEGGLFFLGFDLLVGLVLLFLAFLFYGVLLVSYYKHLFAYLIGFLRWFSSSGTSSSLLSVKSFRWDSSWLELSGGQGVYTFLLTLHMFDSFKFLGVGFLSLLLMAFFLV